MRIVEIDHQGQTYQCFVDDEDYEFASGFTWSIHHGYAEMTSNRRPVQMHRMIMNAGRGEDVIIDHIDGNRLNNQKSNLRRANRFQNQQNRKTNKNNTYPKGIRLLPSGKFNVRVQTYGSRRVIGTFDTLQEAIDARNEVARQEHGEFYRAAHEIDGTNT